MLQRLFAALEYFPSHSQSPPKFYSIFRLLSEASIHSTTPLSLKVVREVVVQRIPTVLRKTKSISLALALAQSAVHRFVWWDHFNLSEWPSVTLDKVMLEIWSECEGVEGRTEENLKDWKEFRSYSLRWRGVNLADLNGSLPTLNPRATRTGPSRLDAFLSILRINRVRVLYFSLFYMFLPFTYQGTMRDKNIQPDQQDS